MDNVVQHPISGTLQNISETESACTTTIQRRYHPPRLIRLNSQESAFLTGTGADGGGSTTSSS